jgi:hypothetical protein
LQAQSGLLTGKRVRFAGGGVTSTGSSSAAKGTKGGLTTTTASAVTSLSSSPAAEDLARLQDFGVHVKLVAPSPSPETLMAEQQDELREQRRISGGVNSGDINALMDLPDTINRTPIQQRKFGSIASVTLPLIRRRRNTILG